MNESLRRGNALSLPASLVLSSLMFLMLSFFMTYNATGLSVPAAWLIVAAATFAFWRMVRTGATNKYRKLMFVLGALLFFPSFIAILLETRGSMFVTPEAIFLNETPFCHIVMPMAIIPYLLKGVLIFPARLTGHFASVYAMISIWIVASLTLGRGWCSWVCFYGGWDEGFSSIPRKARLAIKDPEKKIRYFNFAMLIFIVLASLATFTAVYCAWLCPFKMVTEYSEVTGAASMIAFVLFTVTFVGFVVVLPLLTKKRVQCMSFCPFGAFQSLAGKLSPYRVRINSDACTRCMACVRACPTMSIHEDCITSEEGKVLLTCTNCGACMEACPKKAIRYEFSWKPCKPQAGHLDAAVLRLKSGKPSSRFLGSILGILAELLGPAALIPFSGWLFGCIIMGSFATGTLSRVLNLFLHGSFLLK